LFGGEKLMNLIEILQTKFPTKSPYYHYIVRDDGNGVLYIDRWDESLGEFPTQQMLTQWEAEANQTALIRQASEYIRQLIENKPLERQYDSVTTICTYINSSNVLWQDEAQAFIDWRDSVLSYAYSNMYNNITLESFLENIPEMVWPN
jgi:hypothetical protein